MLLLCHDHDQLLFRLLLRHTGLWILFVTRAGVIIYASSIIGVLQLFVPVPSMTRLVPVPSMTLLHTYTVCGRLNETRWYCSCSRIPIVVRETVVLAFGVCCTTR
jgi:hypothetical protein